MCGDRSEKQNKTNNLLSFPEAHHHFRQFDHSKLSMIARILEQIYHPSKNPLVGQELHILPEFTPGF